MFQKDHSDCWARKKDVSERDEQEEEQVGASAAGGIWEAPAPGRTPLLRMFWGVMGKPAAER